MIETVSEEVWTNFFPTNVEKPRNSLRKVRRVELSAVNKKNINPYRSEVVSFSQEMESFREISLYDKEYPERLKELQNPPKVIYTVGDVSLLKNRAISIIGTRKPSIYGQKQAETFASEIAKQGFVVISGMARGIDSCAHKGAITADGKTIAILGCGVDICYPVENEGLKKIIEKNGLVISPFPLGTKPLPRNFPIRNALIAALGDSILVIECSEKSGTFSTVNFANKLNRNIWTIPTNLDSLTGKGNIKLLKNGAGLALSVSDITGSNVKGKALTKESKGFISNFHPSSPVSLEELAEKTGLDISEINNKLLELELEGKIVALPNKTYIRG
jgi:DNA processing protein